MFDQNDPVHLALLKGEVGIDPESMGYAAVVAQTTQLLKLLNDPDNNVNGDVANRPFDSAAMLDALVPTELNAQQTDDAASDYTTMLLHYAVDGADIASYKVRWRDMFAGNSNTVSALDAQTSPLSRAEVIFGQGTKIAKSDWFAARDS